MKITSEGQVTIPQEIREKAGPHAEVEFFYDGKSVTIVKDTQAKKATRGAKLVQRMRGKGDVTLTTEQIMALTRPE